MELDHRFTHEIIFVVQIVITSLYNTHTSQHTSIIIWILYEINVCIWFTNQQSSDANSVNTIRNITWRDNGNLLLANGVNQYNKLPNDIKEFEKIKPFKA